MFLQFFRKQNRGPERANIAAKKMAYYKGNIYLAPLELLRMAYRIALRYDHNFCTEKKNERLKELLNRVNGFNHFGRGCRGMTKKTRSDEIKGETNCIQFSFFSSSKNKDNYNHIVQYNWLGTLVGRLLEVLRRGN